MTKSHIDSASSFSDDSHTALSGMPKQSTRAVSLLSAEGTFAGGIGHPALFIRTLPCSLRLYHFVIQYSIYIYYKKRTVESQSIFGVSPQTFAVSLHPAPERQ